MQISPLESCMLLLTRVSSWQLAVNSQYLIIGSLQLAVNSRQSAVSRVYGN